MRFEQHQLQVLGPEFQQLFQQQQRDQSAQQQNDQRLRREYQLQQQLSSSSSKQKWAVRVPSMGCPLAQPTLSACPVGNRREGAKLNTTIQLASLR